jgi:hypothetical protein
MAKKGRPMSKDGIVYKQIWDTLRGVKLNSSDVSFIEKTSGNKSTKLHYLSWSAALRILTDNFPDHKIEFERFDRAGKIYDVMYYASEGCSVHCTITINGVSRDMWLAVTNYKHDAVTNPDARDISDSKMRCMVKCLAVFGLGLDIYEGKFEEPEHENQTG